VRDCINELYQVKHLLDNPDAVELALLFHYSVYIPGQENNEEQSSLLAEKTLTQRGV
jgi:predicted metal-dependent HD superfamily phosphohydrolase